MKYICLGYLESGKFEGMTDDQRNAEFAADREAGRGTPTRGGSGRLRQSSPQSEEESTGSAA